LFVAYKLTILKVFPSLFANSVWLIPLASNSSFIRFMHTSFLINDCKNTKFYLVMRYIFSRK